MTKAAAAQTALDDADAKAEAARQAQAEADEKATAAADPPLDPPGERSVSQGFRVAP